MRLFPPVVAIVAIATSLLALRGQAVATGHDPPPVSLHYELSAEELILIVNVQEPVYREWFGSAPSTIPEMDEEAYVRELALVRDLLRSSAAVEADGVAVAPRVLGIDFLEQVEENDFLNYVVIEVAFGMKAVPGALALSWREFRTDRPAWPLLQVDATIEYLTDLQQLEFSPEASVCSWIQPDLPRLPHPSELRVTVRAPMDVPIASWACLLLGLLLAGVAWRGDWERRLSWLLIGSVLVLCVPLAMAPPVAWRPPWQAAFELPTADAARYIFESLHRNVYRAFDYQTESEVYDALAQSVEAGLLDSTYDEVYRSLVMQEEGGVLSRVRGVEILESAVELPERPLEPRFEVQCRWRVTGSVEHWGHRHLRTNEYRARYGLRGEGSRWRLASVEVTDLGRVDDPEAPR